MTKPNLKNYTTTIPSEKSIMEIEQILTKFGASAILKDYNGDGSVKAISFYIVTEHGKMPFKMPMNDRQIAQYLSEQYSGYTKKENVKNDIDAARRIGWRILKDWIHSQLSLINIGLAKVQEVFLPYAYDYNQEKTFYEILEEKKFKGLLLEDSSGKGDE